MGDECIFRHFSISWGNNYLITCTAGGKENVLFMVITLVDTYEVNKFAFLLDNCADRLYKKHTKVIFA